MSSCFLCIRSSVGELADGLGDGLGLVCGVEPCVADEVTRALGRALAAGDTLGVVDAGQIIHNVDGVVLAGALADLAAQAADIAVFPKHGALFLRGAGDGDVGAVRAAVAAGIEEPSKNDLYIGSTVIPKYAPELFDSLL